MHKTYLIEFYDIGGYSNHKTTVKMFYPGADGKTQLHSVSIPMWISLDFMQRFISKRNNTRARLDQYQVAA